MPLTSTGARVTFAITLLNPGPAVPDGDGGWTNTPVPLGPGPVCGSITPAPRRQDYEQAGGGSTIGHDSSVVVLPYLPGVTTQTSLTWADRHGTAHLANSLAVTNPDGRDLELHLEVVEVAR
jgi:hypothetical protein